MDPNYIVALLAGVGIVLLLLWPKLQARRLRNQDLSSLQALLPPEMRDQSKLLLYFWAPSCVMCRNMSPVIQRLAAEREDVLAIDVSRQAGLARELGIRATPSLVLLHDGKVAALQVGAKSEQQIRQMIEA